jgi:FKBP-type peptidyl-prolyl cis-trans isomerase
MKLCTFPPSGAAFYSIHPMAQTPVRSFFYLLLLGVILLTIALVVRSGMLARRNPGEPINAAMRSALAEDQPEMTTQDALLVDQLFPTAETTKSGLRYVVRAPGSGPTPAVGATVVANYAGRFLDGTQFDSSYQRGQPIEFPVGTGGVIKGWDEALLTMRKGEKRTLIIPYWLGYGEAGRPPVIPPRATLVFEVELVDIK